LFGGTTAAAGDRTIDTSRHTNTEKRGLSGVFIMKLEEVCAVSGWWEERREDRSESVAKARILPAGLQIDMGNKIITYTYGSRGSINMSP
jgi:hypothetical protein